MISFEILNIVLVVGMIVSALSLLFLDKLLPSVIAMAVMGSFLALEFLVLSAPDVAIAEAAVGAILTPLLFIITLRKIENKKGEEKK